MGSYTSHHRPRGEDLDGGTVLVLGLIAQLAFLLVLVAKPGGESGVRWFDDIALAAFSLGAAAIAALAAGQTRGSRRGKAWACISAGLFLNAFGEIAWGVQELVLGKEDIFPSVADIGYLGMYPLVFLGLLLMPQAPATGLRRMKVAVDVLIGISAVFAISSTLILGKLVSGGDSSTFDTAIGLAYPLADVAIILAVLVVIGRSRRAQGSSSLAYLAVGFVAIAFADSLYTYLTEIGEYSSGSYIDAGWIAGYCIIAYGAYVGARHDSPSGQIHGEDDEPAPLWQPLAMYAPLVPLGALLLAQSDASDGGLLVAFLVIVALMFCRQMIAHIEDLTVNQRLTELTTQLGDRLRTKSLELWQRQAFEPGQDPADRPMPAPTRDWS